MDETARTDWDVIVMGGALAGAATVCLLRRKNPSLRVLILERSEKFKRRVGESTVEISAHFLGRVLGLTEHLLDKHVPKQGMRFWFANDRARALDQCSETGPRYNVRLPGYQVDRAVLDEQVLATALAEGASVQRSARIRRVQLSNGGAQTIEWDDAAGAPHTSTARWIVDASGFAAILARQEGWFTPNTAHPTATCWSRWTGVRSLDSREFTAKYPAWSARVKGLRNPATNHLTGRGWWAWFIPLKGGDVSVGVTYDQRITELPPGPHLGERLRTMLVSHPVGRELLADAHWQEGDVHFRRDLAYSTTTFATDGAVLVGDAAGFIDPFYSPGMDWIVFTTSAAATLITDSFRGKPVAPRVARHNAQFARSYDRWFRALYRNKYYYIADYELMTLAFRLDLGLYYLGVVALPFRHGNHLLETPPFTSRESGWAFFLMQLYNRRFAAIAESRHRRGVFGRHNDRRFFAFTSYEFNRRLPVRVAGLVFLWLGVELREGWRTWFAPAHRPTPTAAPLAAHPLPHQT
ncbi:MAG: NAD(P)/FAD-dependent oxidoreductase [Opitutaceae bacterium]|nr:NAD(P)/FAD-dependent oxidoreductase [Opitutaceae bacterium]